jgi:hypothetical protein
MTRRDGDPARARDAAAAAVERERAAWEPLDEVPADAHVTLRTDRDADSLVADLLSLLDQRLARLRHGRDEAVPTCHDRH